MSERYYDIEDESINDSKLYDGVPPDFITYWKKTVDKLQRCCEQPWNTCIGTGIIAFRKSCKYTDKINKKTVEFFENKIEIFVSNQISLENQIKHVQNTEQSVQELKTENQELKSLVYGILDEINELKDHNKSLSERIQLLENKPPMILVN